MSHSSAVALLCEESATSPASFISPCRADMVSCLVCLVPPCFITCGIYGLWIGACCLFWDFVFFTMMQRLHQHNALVINHIPNRMLCMNLQIMGVLTWTLLQDTCQVTFKAQAEQKRMLIYWKCGECLNSVLKKSSINSFDHLAFVLTLMYAKAPCHASQQTQKYKQTKVALCLSPSFSSISFPLYSTSK